MIRLRWPHWLLLSMLTILQTATAPWAEVQPEGCQWHGPSSAWVLALHPPAGEISGSLGSDIVPFLQRNGIPVSVITREADNASLRLKIAPSTTTQEMLEEIEHQASGYRYSVINDKVVVYPRGDEYDTPIALSTMNGVTRARALVSSIRELKAKSSAFLMLDMPVLRGAGEKTPYGDTIDVGGYHTVVEHLVSLLQKRPSLAFRVAVDQNNRLSFGFSFVHLIQKIALQAPSAVAVRSAFQAKVTGVLSDGSVVSLAGRECYVEYAVGGNNELEVDDFGLVVAHKKGLAAVVARYDGKSALVKVKIQ
jgi:hypothetical protein